MTLLHSIVTIRTSAIRSLVKGNEGKHPSLQTRYNLELALSKVIFEYENYRTYACHHNPILITILIFKYTNTNMSCFLCSLFLCCTTGTSGFFQICWLFECIRFGDYANILAHHYVWISKLHTVCAKFIVLQKRFYMVKFIIDCNE